MAIKRKLPLRKCAGCQEMKDKRELIRVIRTPEDEIRLDATGKANGRGVYLCRNEKCIQTALKKGSLQRSLSRPIPEEVAEALLKEFGSIEE